MWSCARCAAILGPLSWAWSRPAWVPPPLPTEGHPLGLDGGKVRPGPHGAAPGPRMAGMDRGQSAGRRTAPRPSWAVLVVLCLCRVSLHGITNRYTTSGRVFSLIL